MYRKLITTLSEVRAGFFAFVLLLVLQGCYSQDDSSGGGIGGSGIVPLGVTGVTVGAITDFGSVVINGERYNTDNAAYFVNGKSAAQTDLRIGMNVLGIVDFSISEASEVYYVPSLIGPIESVDMVEKSFSSLGQTVQLGGGTTFENISLLDIAPGMVVEVSGLRNATGMFYATFIRVAPNSQRFQLSGAVLSDIGSSQEFSLNGLKVDFSQADLSQITDDDLDFGDKVYVTADASSYSPLDSSLKVDSVRVANEPMVTAGDFVEYEGIVSAYRSPYEFDVYWQPVTATEQTVVEFQDGSSASLSMVMLNTRVQVEGLVQVDGSYRVTKIILIATENTEISGVIERVTSSANSFSVLGLEITVNDQTLYEGSTGDDTDIEVVSFAGLAVGQYVEVESTFLGNRLIANAVEVDDWDERAILEGPITEIDAVAGILKIINQEVVLGAQTRFENKVDVEINREEFFNSIQVGANVKARWEEYESVTLPANTIQIEN